MILNILFVDDESNLISGLKRMLRPLRTEWNFFFAISGYEALDILAENKIDVIVTDMRMPQMSGAELLDIVKEKYPSLIRIILSGESDVKLAMHSTISAHQFIAKPIAAEELKEKINHTFELYSILNSDSLRQVVNGIDKLPSLPETYLKIETELRKDEFSLKYIADIISNDLVMSAKVLQIVNSAFFGLAREITNINQAVNMIGADTIKSLVIMVQVFKSFQSNEKISIVLTQIYQHSLRVAKSSKLIIKKYINDEKTEDEAYLAGLLHDIGKIVILNTRSYREKILTEIEKAGCSYDEAEYSVLGVTHAEVGAYLVSLWGLPDIVVKTILLHNKLEKIPKDKMNVLSAVFIANSFSLDNKVNSQLLNQMGLQKDLLSIIDICNG